MDWKPGINPSYLFFLFGEIYLFGMKLGIIFFYYLESLFGNLIGELVLKLVVLWRAFNSRPSPHSRTGNISIGWISLHYFYPVMLLSFINERMFYCRTGNISMGWISCTVFTQSCCFPPFIKERDVLAGIYHVTILQGEYDLL